jgi:hypothetical protein
MPAGFDAACRVATCPSKPRRSWKLYAAFATGKELVADFRANEKFHRFYTNRCDGLTTDDADDTEKLTRIAPSSPSMAAGC